MPRPLPGQSPLYKGTLDCFQKTIKNEVNKKKLRIYSGLEFTSNC